MNQTERDRFDAIVEAIMETMPARWREIFDEVPVIVEDVADPRLLEELGLDPDGELLCGLYTGAMLTERSVEDPTDIPQTIHLFREDILVEAGGWSDDDSALREQIRITLLHEVGHHFGLEEDDLEALGYD